MRSSFSALPLLAGAIVAFALGSAASTSGCSDTDPFELDGGAGEGAGPGDGGGGAPFVDNGAELFAALEADLVDACASCHVPAGIADSPFLAPPDVYESVLSWPGIVTKDPDESLFVTYAVSGGGHTGINLDADEDLFGRVQEWLAAEAAAISDPIEDDEPNIEPITPILGFNAIYLTPLDPELTGVAITFTAELLSENSLKLDNLEIHTTSASGIHIVHPVFAVYPKGKPGEADPIDSFAGLDERFAENTSAPIGVGLLILTNWEEDAKLGIGFELAEPYSESSGEGGGGGGGPTGGGCNDVDAFDANAAALFQQRCFSCHGGGDPQANAAVDMSELMTNSAAACAQIKNRVNVMTPANSQVFVTTDPGGNAAHPFKFGGDAGQFNTFKTGVTVWIEAE